MRKPVGQLQKALSDGAEGRWRREPDLREIKGGSSRLLDIPRRRPSTGGLPKDCVDCELKRRAGRESNEPWFGVIWGFPLHHVLPAGALGHKGAEGLPKGALRGNVHREDR